MITDNIQRSLGSLSTWLANEAMRLENGELVVTIKVHGGNICFVEKMVKESTKIL